jgi:hypothetical protein
MNQEQFLSLLRTVLKIIGTLIAAHGSTKLDPSSLETIGGAVMLVAPVIWDLFVHKQSNAIAIVAAIAADPASPVKAPIMENTVVGRRLADDIKKSNPDAVIEVAGTAAAANVAKS